MYWPLFLLNSISLSLFFFPSLSLTLTHTHTLFQIACTCVCVCVKYNSDDKYVRFNNTKLPFWKIEHLVNFVWEFWTILTIHKNLTLSLQPVAIGRYGDVPCREKLTKGTPFRHMGTDDVRHIYFYSQGMTRVSCGQHHHLFFRYSS